MKRVPRPQELVLDCKENSACCPLSMKGSPLPVACYWLVVGQNRICATMIQQPGGAQATRRHTPPGEIFHHGGGGGQFPSLPLYGLQHKVPGLFKAHLVNQHSGGYCGQGGGLLDCRWEGLSGRSRELLHVGEGGGRRGWADEPRWRAHAVNFYALLSFVSRQTTVRWQDRANAHAFFFFLKALKTHTSLSSPATPPALQACAVYARPEPAKRHFFRTTHPETAKHKIQKRFQFYQTLLFTFSDLQISTVCFCLSGDLSSNSI